MENMLKKILMMVTLSVVLNLGKGVVGKPQVPCMFIFGDSLVDNGNNNLLNTIAKANYFPYGIDFPEGPSGRFNNGKTPTDVISQLLEFDDFIPPFSCAKGPEILRGVNFASAAAGIRPETGFQLGERHSFAKQVDHYKTIASQIKSRLRDPKTAANHLKKCLFSINMGSNDYLNNYFMPNLYSSSKHFTPQQFAQILLQEYAQQLRVLYRFGARKFSLTGLGQIGCCPHSLSQTKDSKTCVAKINVANKEFNDNLKALVQNFNREFNDANFTYINVYSIFQDLITHPADHGFTVTNTACCGLGKNGALFTCFPLQLPCFNRSQYLFWDSYHPTEAANAIIGRRSYIAEKPTDVYPIDIRTLVRM